MNRRHNDLVLSPTKLALTKCRDFQGLKACMTSVQILVDKINEGITF